MADNPLQSYNEKDNPFRLPGPLAIALAKPTPRSFVKQRPALGGGTWDYVDTGYVRRALVSIFGHHWNVENEVVTPMDLALQLGQIAVKVRLTILSPVDGKVLIVREAFGSSEVKKYGDTNKKAGEVMDLANDLKAAQADGFKKACSSLGIAQDIYEPKVEATLKEMAEAFKKKKA